MIDCCKYNSTCIYNPKKPDDINIINYYIIILNKIKSYYILNTNKINFLFYYLTKKLKEPGWLPGRLQQSDAIVL